MSENKPNAVSAIITLILLGFLFWFLWGGGVENKVAADAVEQYRIAERQGDKIQICVQAASFPPRTCKPKMRPTTEFGKRLKNRRVLRLDSVELC